MTPAELLAQEIATLTAVEGLVNAALGGNNEPLAEQIVEPFVDLAKLNVYVGVS